MDALTANLLANGAIGIILLASFGLALKIEGIVRSRLFHLLVRAGHAESRVRRTECLIGFTAHGVRGVQQKLLRAPQTNMGSLCYSPLQDQDSD